MVYPRALLIRFKKTLQFSCNSFCNNKNYQREVLSSSTSFQKFPSRSHLFPCLLSRAAHVFSPVLPYVHYPPQLRSQDSPRAHPSLPQSNHRFIILACSKLLFWKKPWRGVGKQSSGTLLCTSKIHTRLPRINEKSGNK